MNKLIPIISGILIIGGFGTALAVIISMIVESSYFGFDTLEQKGTVVLGAFIVGGIGLGIYVKIISDDEKKKEEQS